MSCTSYPAGTTRPPRGHRAVTAALRLSELSLAAISLSASVVTEVFDALCLHGLGDVSDRFSERTVRLAARCGTRASQRQGRIPYVPGPDSAYVATPDELHSRDVLPWSSTDVARAGHRDGFCCPPGVPPARCPDVQVAELREIERREGDLVERMRQLDVLLPDPSPLASGSGEAGTER